MARFNEILAGRLNRAIQKFTSMKGEPPAPQLSGEMVPVFPLFWGAENRYLEGWQRFGFLILPNAAGVGNVNAYRLRNPAKSGVVAVVDVVPCDGGEAGGSCRVGSR